MVIKKPGFCLLQVLADPIVQLQMHTLQNRRPKPPNEHLALVQRRLSLKILQRCMLDMLSYSPDETLLAKTEEVLNMQPTADLLKEGLIRCVGLG